MPSWMGQERTILSAVHYDLVGAKRRMAGPEFLYTRTLVVGED